MNLETFVVQSVMIHDVPRPDPGAGPLVLTDAPVALEDDLRGYFKDKIVDSLRSRGLEVVEDPSGSPAVRDAVTSITQAPIELVPRSRSLAEHLYKIQTNVNSPGLLTVVTGSVDGLACLAVLKLEREKGLRCRIDVQEGGQTVIDIELLRDLTLTDRTRVFKTAVLIPGAAGLMEGRASDDQRGRKEGEGVADFFLFKFLGCQLATNAERATRDFVRVAENFFNEHVANVERRAGYTVALLAKMQDNTLHINPREFANQNLESNDRPSFLVKMRDAGLDPDIPFEKDTALSRVKGFRLVFQSGMVLVGSRDDLDRKVDVDNNGARISDAPQRIMGR